MTAKHFCFITVLANWSCMAKSQELTTVPFVDINKYCGKWYEVAAYPQKFQQGCTCTTAEYTSTGKDYLLVENRCVKNSINGKVSSVKGKAFVKKNTGNAQLSVQFFWPFKAKYWIIELANDYSYSVVSHPNRKYLWILSRTPKMEAQVYKELIGRLKTKGFETAKLQLTVQQ